MYQVLSVEQTEIYTTGDSTTHVRAVLLCDTTADLPGINDITGYTLEIGSRALVIQDAAKYCMQSDGTWTLQQSADLQSIITQLSDIDDRLNDTTADAAWAKSQVENYIYPALKSVINRGPKNVLDMSTAQTATDNGVTFTVNSDSSITITGSAIPPNNGWFIVPFTVPDGKYIFSGMQESGGTANYRQEIRTSPRGSVIGTNTNPDGDEITISSGGATIYYHIRAASGYDFGTGATVKPMLSIPAEYAVTPDYVPYAPTTRQLLDLIHSYHP